ncbi:MAG: hypothetical protein J6D08_17355 [Lachnospiraceae bacterium]|nr:hypothetical protein [Lachnospiraceae bacterium]
MTMHDRIMNGLLFTDMCEGMPEERLRANRLSIFVTVNIYLSAKGLISM